MSDPAGWYPDPTARHELRYWDGYAWLDNVSDQGAAANDPLGGKPMPAPSEAAAATTTTAPPAAPAKKSKAPLFIGIGAAVVVLLVVGFLVLKKDDNKDGKGVTTLTSDKTVTIEEDGKDPVHPTVHTLHSNGNQIMLIDIESKESGKNAGYIIEASQGVVDSLNKSISGVSDELSSQLKDACSNLREEDIGTKGNVAYSFEQSDNEKLNTFTIFPIAGDYEIVPVLIDDSGKCVNGKLTMRLTPKTLDFSGASNVDDLVSKLSGDSDLSTFFSS